MKWKKSITLIAGTILGLGMLSLVSNQAVKADTETTSEISVNAGKQLGDKQHAANGYLAGLRKGTIKDQSLINDLKPQTFTQPSQSVDGKPNEHVPNGTFTDILPMSKAAGSKVVVRFMDMFHGFPYEFSSNEKYAAKIKDIVTNIKNSGDSDQVYAYEIANEPEGSGSYPFHNMTQDSFMKYWNAAYAAVKAADPHAKILGPSLNTFGDGSEMYWFLKYAKEDKTLPDYLCWHVWSYKSFSGNVAHLKAEEKSLGLKDIPIFINEYSDFQEQAVPGWEVHYMQVFDNNRDVAGANMAFWFQPGRLSNLLTYKSEPTGAYWFYKWYADMDGQQVSADNVNSPDSKKDNQYDAGMNGDYPSPQIGTVASLNADNSLTVLFGGKSGSANIQIHGLSADKFGDSVSVEAEESPWYGADTAVKEPTKLFTGTFKVNNGSITVPVKDLKLASGYRLVVRKSTQMPDNKINYNTPDTSMGIYKEAEDAQMSGAHMVYGSYASDGQFVRSTGTDAKLTFKVDAPADGQYTFNLGYGNGNAQKQDATENISVNGQAQDVSLPFTGNGTGSANNRPYSNGVKNGSIDATVQDSTLPGTSIPETLTIGNRVVKTLSDPVTLKKGENTITLTQGKNSAEIDFIQLLANSTNNNNDTNSGNSSSSSSATSSSSSVSSSSSSTTTSSTSSSSSSSSSEEPATNNHSVPKSAAKINSRIYSLKGMYLYKSADFTKSQRIAKYVKRARVNRPMFIVTGYAWSDNGNLRYQVRDANRGSKSYGRKGYITAKNSYVSSAYYQTVPKSKTVTVVSKKGINAYGNRNLTDKIKHYKKGHLLKVKKLVNYHKASRYVLSNGDYITGNKQMIVQGRY